MSVLRTVLKGSEVRAGSDLYYPSNCLGGWESPGAASGEPQTSGSDTAAYLAPNVAAQIFCGYFPVEARENMPSSARVRFAFSFGSTAETEMPETLPKEDAGSGEPPAEPTEPEPSVDVPEPPAAHTPTPEPEPAAEEPAPVSLLRLVIGRAHAQSSSDYLEVSYSFDGDSWHAAGRVTQANARSFSIDVPVSSWQELQNLQVAVAALPTHEERPPIYLESVALKVEVSRTLTEVAGDGVAAVGGALEETLAVVDTLGEALLGLVLPEEVPVVPAPVVPAPAPPPPPPAPVAPAPQTVLRFSVAGDAVAEGGRKAPDVRVGTGGLRLTVAGPCTKPYFVVLTYRSVKEFREKPRSFVSNYAGECRGSSFSYGMQHLPVTTEPGTYYLVVGMQGEEGSWEPVTGLLPIAIDQVEVIPE